MSLILSTGFTKNASIAPPTDVRDRVYIDCTSLTCKQAEDTTTELEISKVYLY